MNQRMTPLLAVAAAAGLLLAGCAGAEEPTETPAAEQTVPYEDGTTMARLAEAGKITIGTKFDQPLFGLENLDGEPEGFDAEVGKIIAGQLGIAAENITWVETVTANREPFLQSGQVDMVVATYTINDERKKAVSFAGPYYVAGQDILVPAGNPDGIDGPEWFSENPEAAICTASGSTSFQNIAQYTSNIIEAAGYSECLEPIRTGQAVALTTDNVILAGLAFQSDGEFEVVGNPFSDDAYGIGVQHDDTDFRMWINDVLEASDADGSLAAAWDATIGDLLPRPAAIVVDRY